MVNSVCIYAQKANIFYLFDPKTYSEKSFPLDIDNGSEIECCTERICFYLSTDLDDWELTLHALIKSNASSGFKSEIIDITEPTAYSSNFHFYRSNSVEDGYILLWENVSEFVSFIYSYLILNDSIIKIGNFDVFLDCTDCDDAVYPIESIDIKKLDDKIFFNFTSDLVLNDSIKIEANSFQYIYSNGNLTHRISNQQVH